MNTGGKYLVIPTCQIRVKAAKAIFMLKNLHFHLSYTMFYIIVELFLNFCHDYTNQIYIVKRKILVLERW